MATTYYVRPSDGKRRKVSDRWRLPGILFGVPAMLVAGLWLHSLLAAVGTIALGLAAEWITGLREGDPDYLITYFPGWIFTAIYGGFIPMLRRRKYERLGWKRVEVADEFQ